MNIIYEIIKAVCLIIISLLFGHYFSEKFKNLATAQDIAKITTKVESIKAEYLNQTYAWARFFDFEFEHVKAVWDASYDLQISARSLSPIIDRVPLDEESQKAVRQDRHREYYECISQYQKKVLKNQPFIPQEIYNTSKTIMRLVIPLAIDFELCQRQEKEPDWMKIVDTNSKLDEQITEFCDQIQTYIYSKLGSTSTTK